MLKSIRRKKWYPSKSLLCRNIAPFVAVNMFIDVLLQMKMCVSRV